MCAAEGYALPEEKCVPVAPARYVFKRAIDVNRLVKTIDEIETKKRQALRRLRYPVTNEDGTMEALSHAELDPDFDRFPHRARRLFNDWAASSAGRSGARLCDSWVVQPSDWTDPKTGERSLELIPLWTFGQKLAKVDAGKGDIYALFGKLQTLDRRVKVPFGWYFYMLHGNRVSAGAGQRVLEAAEDGLIVLPEHDYQVLKAWSRRNYGF